MKTRVQWYNGQRFRRECRAQTRQRLRRKLGLSQEIDEYKTGVQYSYYRILILDTIQPIVNSSQRMES